MNVSGNWWYWPECHCPQCDEYRKTMTSIPNTPFREAPQTTSRDETEAMKKAIEGLAKTNQRLVRINEELRATVRQLSYLLADARLNEQRD
jgi:hypothetical protein